MVMRSAIAVVMAEWWLMVITVMLRRGLMKLLSQRGENEEGKAITLVMVIGVKAVFQCVVACIYSCMLLQICFFFADKGTCKIIQITTPNIRRNQRERGNEKGINFPKEGERQ